MIEAIEFHEPCYFRIRTTGAVTMENVRDFIDAMELDPRIPKCCMLVDARGVSELPTAPELRDIAHWMGRLVDRGMGPIAIVTEATFVYGVVRMFATYAEAVSLQVQPFKCMNEAQTWLDLTCC